MASGAVCEIVTGQLAGDRRPVGPHLDQGFPD
jgi:hypothetical protein